MGIIKESKPILLGVNYYKILQPKSVTKISICTGWNDKIIAQKRRHDSISVQ